MIIHLNEYQELVGDWCIEAFGDQVATNTLERAARFIEEAIELVQSLGLDKAEVERMMHYVYSRHPGNTYQEVGGVSVTLAALCASPEVRIDWAQAAEAELNRIRHPESIARIREHHNTKPGAMQVATNEGVTNADIKELEVGGLPLDFDLGSFDELEVVDGEGPIPHHSERETNFQRVMRWMQVFGQDTPASPQFPAKDVIELRKKLIGEEFSEYLEAIEKGDLVEVADALGDMLVVVYGTGVAFGIDLDEVYEEIMDSNDSKAGEDGKPIFREDGKVLKGPNFFLPNLKLLLDSQIRRAAKEEGNETS